MADERRRDETEKMTLQQQELVLRSAVDTLEALALRQLQAAKELFDATRAEDLRTMGRETMAVARSLRKLCDAPPRGKAASSTDV